MICPVTTAPSSMSAMPLVPRCSPAFVPLLLRYNLLHRSQRQLVRIVHAWFILPSSFWKRSTPTHAEGEGFLRHCPCGCNPSNPPIRIRGQESHRSQVVAAQL